MILYFLNYLFLLNQISLYLGENSIKEFLQEIKNSRHENDEVQLFNELIKDISDGSDTYIIFIRKIQK